MFNLALVSKSMKPIDLHSFVRRTALTTAVILGALAAQPGLGQSPTATTTPATAEDATPQTHPNDPMLWNVDRMMEDAVQQISKRYSLNPEQEKYTRLMLTQRVRSFLKNHESDVRALLKEQLDWKIGLKPASAESMRAWATRAKPLYEDAMKAILDGNKEWGEILSDQQKKIHLGDLNQMNVNFDGVKVLLRRWEDGGGMPTEVNPRGMSGSGDKGITQPSPPPPPNWPDRKIEDMWETYVIKFIQVYGLDEKQANAAHSIKREMLGEAAKYREARKADFDEMVAASGDPKKPNNPAETRKKKQMLERPIREMFVKMTGRLDGLLNQSQRESIKPDDKQLLDSIVKSFASDSAVPITPPKSDPPPTTKVEPGGNVTRASATSVPATEDKPAAPPAATSAPAKPDAEKPASPPAETPKVETNDAEAAKAERAKEEKASDGKDGE